MIVFETATTVYKSLHGLTPDYMQLMFTKFTSYFPKFAEAIFEKSKGVRVPEHHQTFYFLMRTYCILIFVYLSIELYVD